MKLGTETGSVMNHLYSRMTKGQPQPEVGMGVTFLMWSDRRPGTIIEVGKTGRYLSIVVQEDTYKVVKGTPFDGTAEYEYSSNPDGRKYTYRFRNDRWEQIYRNPDTNRWVKSEGDGLRIGERDRYYDPHF